MYELADKTIIICRNYEMMEALAKCIEDIWFLDCNWPNKQPHERCAYSQLDIYWCVDTCTWLVKWKKIDAAEKERLTEQILRIQET